MELENLVSEAQKGSNKAAEEILNKFKPFIIKTSNSIFISGYEFEDLLQIGYLSLIKAILKYNPDKNKNFTAYAINSIKNNYYYEIRQKAKLINESTLNIEIEDGIELIENIISDIDVEKSIILTEDIKLLYSAIKNLPDEDKQLIEYIYFKQKKLKEYALFKNIKYKACLRKRDRLLKKLKDMLSE